MNDAASSRFPLPERPKLRHAEAFPIEHQGERAVALRDPFGFSDKVIVVPVPVFALATLMDGTRGTVDIQAEWAKKTGELIFAEQVEAIVRAFDEALFLDSERFRAHRREAIAAYKSATVRPSSHAGGAYPGTPQEIETFIEGFRAQKIDVPLAPGRLVGVVAPHIDPRRGGKAYAAAYDAIERAGGADTYVIFGTAHQGALRADEDGALRPPRSLDEHVEDLYIFTRKSFETPLGVAETDRAFVDRLEARVGRPVDRAELSHRTEHSVEFQVLYLQDVEARLAKAQGRPPRPIRIVPLLCGSLQPWTDTGASPAGVPGVARALAAIRETIAEEEAAGRRVLAIAGADLAHIGLKFGHPKPVDETALAECEEKDRASLEPVARGDGEGWFRFVAEERDRRNICGVSCMYAVLKVLAPDGAGPVAKEGRVLAYGQAKEPEAGSMVSYCSVGLWG